MDKDLAGKVVVITGASSGFGKGAALEFGELVEAIDIDACALDQPTVFDARQHLRKAAMRVELFLAEILV